MRPASEAQRSYLMDLVRRLDAAAAEAPEGIRESVHVLAAAPDRMEISSADASRAIDAIVRGIAKLGGSLSEREKAKADGTLPSKLMMSEAAKKRHANRIRAEEEREKRYDEAKTYNEEAKRRFIQQHGTHVRLDPEWRGSIVLKIWQSAPDSMSWTGAREIARYWKWACRHPSHNGRVVRGQTWRGQEAAAGGAQRHWDRFHKSG